MKVFKFGGASVKDAQAVRNVSHILSLYTQDKLIVVISAMGKTTNAMEAIVDALWKRDEKKYQELVEERYQFHLNIVGELFPEAHFAIYQELETVFDGLKNRYNKPLSDNYNFEYDQIVSIGEVISTMIVEAFLKEEGHSTMWVDSRKYIRTNHTYREGEVDWGKTETIIKNQLLPEFKLKRIAVTQGFVGHTSEGFTTTLGREGSDFSAAIYAYCADAESVTIWKDVPGMLNADPKWFDNTVKLDKISFKEAIELAYYGATVIHPKTIKPLQNKGIELHVKSFIDPSAEGTTIQASGQFDHLVPSFIFKMDQVLMSFTPKDFSFIVEENLGDIFQSLAKQGVKINLMQNSALSFSIVFDRSKMDPMQLVEAFKGQYEVRYNEGLELVTIRHYDQATIDRVNVNKEILVEQRTRQTIRMVMKDLG
ncbi:MAG TPA: aspartate kinase [Fluviicola sp.]|nr:aspartate kinase [Fluviicola sp.]